MNAAEILTKAKALIDTPDKWTKGEFARDKNGSRVDANSNYAVCFCSIGAIRKVAPCRGSEYERGYISALQALATACGKEPAVYNDFATHEDVMEKFDRAIEWAKHNDH